MPNKLWDAIGSGGARVGLIDAQIGRGETMASINSQTKSIADALNKHPRGIVLFQPRSDMRSAIALLGALRSQHVLLLARPNLDTASIARLQEEFEPELILESRCSSGSNVSCEVAVRLVHPLSMHRTLDSELRLLLQTSGSLGKPKVVRVSRSNLSTALDQVTRALRINCSDRVMVPLPLSFVYGLTTFLSHLAAGASVVINNGSLLDAKSYQVAAMHRVNSLASVSFMLPSLLTALEGNGLHTIKNVMHSGEGIGRGVLERLVALRNRMPEFNFIRMYGMTEATGRVCVLPPDEFTDAPYSCGYPVDGMRVCIAPDGEVILSGPNITAGYASCRSELAVNSTAEESFATGDVGKLDERGRLIVQGRRARLAKVMGVRISLDEVEQAFTVSTPLIAIEHIGKICICLQKGPHVMAVRDQADAIAARLNISPAFIIMREVDNIGLGETGKLKRNSIVLPDDVFGLDLPTS